MSYEWLTRLEGARDEIAALKAERDDLRLQQQNYDILAALAEKREKEAAALRRRVARLEELRHAAMDFMACEGRNDDNEWDKLSDALEADGPAAADPPSSKD